MLERRPAKRIWVMGLLVILCTYNLAFANVNVNENTGTPPAKIRTNNLISNGTTETSPTDKATTATPSEKKNESSVKKTAAIAKNCACTCSAKTGRAVAAPGPWWDCTKGCLRSWGVSVVQIAMCGASCAAGVIPLCAFCLGVDISLIMLCSIGCSIYPGTIENPHNPREPILVRKMPGNNRQKAERRIVALAARK